MYIIMLEAKCSMAVHSALLGLGRRAIDKVLFGLCGFESVKGLTRS